MSATGQEQTSGRGQGQNAAPGQMKESGGGSDQLSSGGPRSQRSAETLAAQGATIATEREDFGLRVAPEALVARAPRGGYLQAIDCRQVGLSLVAIGGARRRVEDPLDLSSGIRWLPALGDRLEKGDPVAVVHADDGDAAAAVAERLLAAITIGPDQVPVPPLILDRLS